MNEPLKRSFDLNTVVCAGRLGKDGELKTIPNGTAVLQFSMATEEIAASGEKYTTWIDCVVWGAYGQRLAPYLRKGTRAMVVGKLRTRSWEKDGVKHYRTEVIADKVMTDPTTPGERPASTHADAGVPFDEPPPPFG